MVNFGGVKSVAPTSSLKMRNCQKKLMMKECRRESESGWVVVDKIVFNTIINSRRLRVIVFGWIKKCWQESSDKNSVSKRVRVRVFGCIKIVLGGRVRGEVDKNSVSRRALLPWAWLPPTVPQSIMQWINRRPHRSDFWTLFTNYKTPLVDRTVLHCFIGRGRKIEHRLQMELSDD